MAYYATHLNATTGQELKAHFGDQPAQSFTDSTDTDPQRRADIRASWAAHGVIAYAEYVGGELQSAVSDVILDFLGDLQHLCDGLGVDFDEAVDTARRFHREETNGE